MLDIWVATVPEDCTVPIAVVDALASLVIRKAATSAEAGACGGSGVAGGCVTLPSVGLHDIAISLAA